jgi:hypothetical protein
MKKLVTPSAVFFPCALLAIMVGGIATVTAQDFCNPGAATLTQMPADLVVRTSNNAAWITGLIDGGGTDLTFLSNGGQSRVLLTDPWVNQTISSFNAPLTNQFATFQPNIQENLSAIAAIPNGGDRFFVVDHDFESFVSPNLVDPRNDPRIGVMNLQGSLTQAFRPITGLPAFTMITAIDVSPDGTEIAALDSFASDVFVIDSTNFAVQFRFPLLGFPTSLFRGGVTWGSCETILAVSAFKDNFTSSLVLEYDRTSGIYTGRSIELDNIASSDGAIESVAIDVGFVQNKEVLYVYNAWTDDVYAVDLDYSEFPGRVTNFACSRGGGFDVTAPVRLSWTNFPDFLYDEIVIFQNGVQVASLDSTSTSFTLPSTVRGYNEFAIETRLEGRANSIQDYCSDVDSLGPSWTIFEAVTVAFGLEDFSSLMGMDSTSIVTDIADARVFVHNPFVDNLVAIFSYVLDPLSGSLVLDNTEAVFLFNPGGVIAGYRGLALMNIGGVDRIAVSAVSTGGLPVGGIYEMDGSVFQFFNPIDTEAVGGPESLDLTDWSGDENGDLISYDFLGNRILRFVHDLESATMTAVEAAPAPQCAVYDCDGPLAAGAITVLPNGLYVVTSGGTFDQSIIRAHLSTPFNADPSKSVKFVGQAQGLLLPSDFFAFRSLGLGVGPSTMFGTCHTYFDVTDPETNEPAPESVIFYTMPNMPGHPLPFVGVDFSAVVNLSGASGHPDLEAEQLVDMTSSSATFTTPVARATFASRAETFDYYYHVVNRGSSDASVTAETLLDGVAFEISREDIVLPPGRGIYRAVEERMEKDVAVRVTNANVGNDIQVLIGVRAITEDVSGPMFLRGDVDGSGILDINDPLASLIFQFLGQNRPTCLDAADTNDSGAVDVSDPLHSLGHQFLGVLVIPLPGALVCGPDPTIDGNETDLGCDSFAACDG